MSKQITLENTRAGGFGLPTGQIVPGNGSIAVEPEIWEAAKEHPVVKAMVDGGALIVDGKGKKKSPADRDENGDTAEMQEMRKRFDAAYAAIQTELQAERTKVAGLEQKLAAARQGGGASDKAASAYTVLDKGRGWYAVTQDGKEVTKSLREDDVKGFVEMSADDQAAFVETNKAE